MNIATLRKEIERDEGIKYEIYHDHLGYPTFGIGHFVKTSDAEFIQILMNYQKKPNTL